MNAEMKEKKLTMRALRMRMAAVGILTVQELADKIGCSRESIYFAIERPTRYSRVYSKIQEVIA